MMNADDTVRHASLDYGVGIILRTRAVGGLQQCQVDFETAGVVRWFSLMS